jgi:hypothetical protein
VPVLPDSRRRTTPALSDDTAERRKQQPAVDAITSTIKDLAVLWADVHDRVADGEDPLPAQLSKLKTVAKSLESTSKSIPRLSRSFPQMFSAFERTKLAQLSAALKHIVNKSDDDSYRVVISQADELIPPSLFQVSLRRPSENKDQVEQTPQPVNQKRSAVKRSVTIYNDTSAEEEESTSGESSDSGGEGASDSEEEDLKSDRKLLPSNFFQMQRKIPMPKNKTFLEFFLNRTQHLFTKFSGEKNCSTTLASFWKTFHKEVHIVKQASVADKFAALLEVLEGRAKKEVEHLRHSGRSGYRQAWRTLFLNHGKFHEARENLDEHVRRLRPKSPSGKHIHSYLQLIDSARSKYQGLNLKSEDASSFLMEMLIKRLPNQIVNSYLDRHHIDISRKHLFYKENPRRTYFKFTSEIRQYLDYDCQNSDDSDEDLPSMALAAVGSLAPSTQRQGQGGSQGQGNGQGQGGKNAPAASATKAGQNFHPQEFRPPAEDTSSPAKIPRVDTNLNQGSRSKCQFHPDGADHQSKACPSDARDRKASLRLQRKCFNCFKPGHLSRECDSPNNCLNFCCEKVEPGQRHHTFVCLHPGRFTSRKKYYNPPRGSGFQGDQRNDTAPRAEALTASFVAEQIEKYFRNQASHSTPAHIAANLPSTSRAAICAPKSDHNPSTANRTD